MTKSFKNIEKVLFSQLNVPWRFWNIFLIFLINLELCSFRSLHFLGLSVL